MPARIDKLATETMLDKQPLRSEGEQLNAVLDDLQRGQQVNEISGWETGFADLSRAIDGLLPGLYLLVGPPACGKTAFAKQLLDQVAMRNPVPGIFFTFAESKKELGIRTLARLSGVEKREIRRGSAYLLHRYGAPKAHYNECDQLPPSWEKLTRAAEEAKSWLDSIYLVECGRDVNVEQVEGRIQDLRTLRRTEQVLAVIDDCQRLGNQELPPRDRLAVVTEQLEGAAVGLKVPILAVSPDLGDRGENAPHTWAERIPAADVIMVMERDAERAKNLREPNEAITLHIVKNRGGEKGKLAMDFYPAFAKFAEVVGG